MSATALVAYKCSDVYRPDCEVGVIWNDPRIGIRWPLASPKLSAKDARLSRLDDLSPGSLPQYDRTAERRAAVACAQAA